MMHNKVNDELNFAHTKYEYDIYCAHNLDFPVAIDKLFL